MFGRNEPADVGLTAFGEAGPVAPIPRPRQSPVVAAFAALGSASRSGGFWILLESPHDLLKIAR